MINKAAHIKIGERGEALAVSFLTEQGHRILETNWRYEKGELDIVSTDQKFIIITEVKTRSNSNFGDPHEDVDESKQALLEDTAEAYVNENEIDLEIRFDIISITLEPQISVVHIADAF